MKEPCIREWENHTTEPEVTNPFPVRKRVRAFEKLNGLRLVEMDSSLLREAAKLTAQFGLRAADSTYVAVASRLDLPLVTLDTDQRERAAGYIVIQPIETPLSF